MDFVSWCWSNDGAVGLSVASSPGAAPGLRGGRTHLQQALPALPLAMMGEKTANKIEKSYCVETWVRRHELVLRMLSPRSACQLLRP